MPLSAGTRLGPYEILSALGAGGMGEVYRARDTRLNRDVAIKVLLPLVARDPDRLARFRREAQVLASLNHPNIAHIHGIEEAAGVTALVLELVDGEDLAERIRRGPVPIDEALPIAKQIADALEQAHEHGIIHRDLKPANIKVCADGTVKVLDFGLAKAVEAPGGSSPDVMNSPTLSVHATRSGIILGTAAYMSPEQASAKAVDKRTDLWSFGVVVMEMLTGRQVFTGETVTHVLAEVLKSEPDWTALPANTPVPVRRLLHRCLEKRPRQRLADAADARLEIEDAEEHTSSFEAPAAVVVGRSSRALLWIWAALTIALVAALMLQSTLWRQPAAPPVLRFVPVSFEQGGQRGAVWSPDGKAVAYAARQNADEPMQVYVRYLDSPAATQITHLDSNALPTQWTTSGRIVFGTTRNGKQELWTVSPVGGEPEPVRAVDNWSVTAMTPDGSTLAWMHKGEDAAWGIWTSSPPDATPTRYQPDPSVIRGFFNAPTLKFSPDGKQILFFRNDGNTGEEAWLFPYPANASTPPHRIATSLPTFGGTPQFSWLPDSRRIIVSTSSGAEPDQLYLMDTSSGTFRVISSGTTPQRAPAVSPDGRRLTFLEQYTDYDLTSLDLATARATPLLATQRMEAMPMLAAGPSALVYVTDRNGAAEIWLRQPGQPDRPVVTARDFPPDTTQSFLGPVLSPDATRVIYGRLTKAGAGRLWMSAVAGGSPVQLVKGPEAFEFAGSWSPDGRWFAYWSAAVGPGSLNKVKTTGDAAPQIITPVPGRNDPWVPIWSPRGDWILQSDDGAKLIFVVRP